MARTRQVSMLGGMTTPWHARTWRWAQVNLVEDDPQTWDAAFWSDAWRRTCVQGVIVNAGGMVAYYPSRVPGHQRARFLGDRDLFGEICAAARAQGLTVIARMDASRAAPSVAAAHPDWMCQDADGRVWDPQHGWHLACVNAPWYRQVIPDILREVVARYQVDGFADNCWTANRAICHCAHCRAGFGALPRQVDWDDPVFRRWVAWSHDQRTALWRQYDAVAQAAGGGDCRWVGMVGGDPLRTHLSWCDLPAVATGMPLIFSDTQSRTAGGGFAGNGWGGKLLHELIGWDRPVPESMALYVRGPHTFRRSAAPAAEARTWMQVGIAAGIQPWWHVVGGHLHDRRMLDPIHDLMAWHARHQDLLHHRIPIADVGVVWSHANNLWHGREHASQRIGLAQEGWAKALLRARLTYVPVLPERITPGRFRCLVLPELAVLDDAGLAAIRAHVEAGGSLLASGACAPGIDALLGLRRDGRILGASADGDGWEDARQHDYLRVAAHPLTARFAGCDLLPHGGVVQVVDPAAEAAVPLRHVPSFPVYPPELAWLPAAPPGAPGLVVRGRTAYLAADIDRAYARRGLPDHGDLLGDLLRWGVGAPAVQVAGPGTIDVHLYRQGRRRILHLINLSGADVWPGYREAVLPVGPISVTLPGASGQARLLVDGGQVPVRGGALTLDRLHEHEVLVVDDQE